MRMNLWGRLIAHLSRLIGGPLPYDMSAVNQPAVVSVTEDLAGEGQFWIRQYGRAAGFPQVIHSSKRFTGPTGIEEYIGYGIGMALSVDVDRGSLVFRSEHYFLQMGQKRLRLPSFVTPGSLAIVHRDLGNARFLFSLTLKNRLLGELIHQDAVFRDTEE
jgi:hypothetical protein